MSNFTWRHWPVNFTSSYHFSDLVHISRPQQCHTVLNENIMFLSDEVETAYDCHLCQLDHECITLFCFLLLHVFVFHFCPYLKGIIDIHVSWFDKNVNIGFPQTLLKWDLSKFAWLHIYVRIVNCKLCFLDSCPL